MGEPGQRSSGWRISKQQGRPVVIVMQHSQPSQEIQHKRAVPPRYHGMGSDTDLSLKHMPDPGV
eukprot:351732-Chlamydomonas_euryale.AAC.18